ncbi:copper resistance CopC family protein [Actinoplanes sp. CA-252034]|uniref:copper resistance CopC family protein n=1 Tax=Actinoplanes sp. CA-252034 TaxID=3239906 RepID=UPI003D95EA2E
MRRLFAAAAVLSATLAPGTPAWAHATLVSADPAEGVTLVTAPSAVTLEFNERLNPDFTTIVVSDTAQQRVAASPATVDGARGTLTLTAALSNGGYTVAYRVVSVDGHTVQGSYPFTLADPRLPAAVPAQASVAAAPPPVDGSGGGLTGVLIGVGAGGVVLVTVAARRYLSGRRRTAHR